MTNSWKQDLIWAIAGVCAVASLAFGCGGCVQKQSEDRRAIVVEMTKAGKSAGDIQSVIAEMRR
jgi:hypothetical protein